MKDEFDYVIVGGGSAGCVLANRLSASGRHEVCLLEAGPSDRTAWVRGTNPLYMLFLMNSPTYNWLYRTEVEPANGDRGFFWPRGKVLGGSSAINAMIYTRGNRWDYDHWAELGCAGWSWAEVLPFFKRSERQARGPGAFHGVDGTMNVVDTNFRFPASEAFVESCAEVGIARNDDFNGEEQEGAGFFQVTQSPLGGRRGSAGTDFLDEARARPNLVVETGTLVTRVLFEGRRAIGVECLDPRRRAVTRRVRASKEVILSAGVINTPQLLKLSGVGPREELEALGIPLVHELAGVGENLQDHPDILVRRRDRRRASFSLQPGPYTASFLRRFLSRREPFIYTPTDAGAFVRSSEEEPRPDLQLQFAAVRMEPHGRGLFMPARFGFVLHVCNMRPRSRGRVRLRSASPLDPPRIEANYFADAADLEALVGGLKIARRVLGASAMAPFAGEEEVPGAGVQTDDDLRAFLRRRVETVYHTASSCKMGTDPMAVVDPDLRVHGIEALRVIDASIMPVIPSSNIHAPTVMVAERGAAMILEGKRAAELGAR